MRLTLFLILIISIYSCNQTELRTCYKEITAADYQQLRPLDTLVNNATYLITTTADSAKPFAEFIRKKSLTGFSYYQLDSNAHVINDSTITWYDTLIHRRTPAPLTAKAGLWLYAEFYTVKRDSSLFRQTEETKARYQPDSMPLYSSLITPPEVEGIYYVSNDSLVRVSPQQSAEQFYSFKQDGFYFLPKPGRLYTYVSLDIIK